VGLLAGFEDEIQRLSGDAEEFARPEQTHTGRGGRLHLILSAVAESSRPSRYRSGDGETYNCQQSEHWRMSFEPNVGGRDRLTRATLAVLLTVVAIRSLRGGKRTIGLVASVAALGFGFNAVTCFCGLNRLLGIDTSGE